jgi:predicted DCC family thiol-disulfide oxidoreductase YuxK
VAPPRDRPLVIYDGECAFCRRWTTRLQRWDRQRRLDYLPLQDPRAEEASGRPRSTLEAAAHAVLPSGEVLSGAAAFRAICPFLPGGGVPSALLGVPGALPMAERLYQWISWRWGPVGARAGDRLVSGKPTKRGCGCR